MSTWGIVPAAGLGTRIQPLACSKELLPAGSRTIDGRRRPRAISEHLIERMLHAGVDRLCIVISPGKSDIVAYYGGEVGSVPICYVVQPEPRGLCDALFRALPVLGDDDDACVGLPDTLWFPTSGLTALPPGRFSFLLFPVDAPELFDAVITDDSERVLQIRVKTRDPGTRWIWGAFRLPARTLVALHALWQERTPRDEYFGSLVNAWIARGGQAHAHRQGTRYVDVGSLDGYREAVLLLDPGPAEAQAGPLTSPSENAP